MKKTVKNDTQATEAIEDKRENAVNLRGRYGKIGISAVAAALCFPSECKNPEYAPVTPRTDDLAA